MRQTFLLALLLISVPTASFAKTFGAEEFTLENGMQVVVIPNKRAPVVTHMIWVKAGSADGQAGLSGMAHYLEHLLFKGTPTVPAGQYSRIIKTLGGDDNAFTSRDYTAFYESVPVDKLPRIMEMEADRMQHASPPPEHYKSEKDVVIEERCQRTDNDPRARFGEQMQSVMFVNHPYGTPVIGWMDEIRKYEWPDVKKFYDTWYAPNNMVLVVSGDVTAKELKPLAEKYYGAIPRKDVPSRVRPAVPPAIGEMVMNLRDESIHQPIYQRLYIAPSESRDKKASLALQVLSEIMDGSASARLYRALVVEQKVASGIAFDYEETGLDYGMIMVSGTPADGVAPEKLRAAVDAEIGRLVQGGVTDEEVRNAAQRLSDQAVFARDSLSGPAMIFGAAIATGSSVADVEAWPEDIGRVTKADVDTAARTYLDKNSPWIRPALSGYLLPASELKSKPEGDAVKNKEKVVPDVQR